MNAFRLQTRNSLENLRIDYCGFRQILCNGCTFNTATRFRVSIYVMNSGETISSENNRMCNMA